MAFWLQQEAAHSNQNLPLCADSLAEVLLAKFNCNVGHREWALPPVGQRCQLWQPCRQQRQKIPVPRHVRRLGLGTFYVLLLGFIHLAVRSAPKFKKACVCYRVNQHRSWVNVEAVNDHARMQTATGCDTLAW